MKWYLLFAKAREEEKVNTILRGAGVECYCPRMKITLRDRGQSHIKVEPLFPRYLFVNVSIEEWSQKFKCTRGVGCFVDFDGGPVDIDEKVIKNIRSREKDVYIHIEWKGKRFTRNEKIKVKKGLFKDINAIFEGYLSGEERVCLLLENISSNIKLNISKYYL